MFANSKQAFGLVPLAGNDQDVKGWFKQFELVAELNGWFTVKKEGDRDIVDDKRAKFLRLFLNGPVQTTYSQLADDIKTDYTKVVHHLDLLFRDTYF